MSSDKSHISKSSLSENVKIGLPLEWPWNQKVSPWQTGRFSGMQNQLSDTAKRAVIFSRISKINKDTLATIKIL